MANFRSDLNMVGASALVKQAAAEGLGVGGELILSASNEQVPHEDGDLSRTGAVAVDEEALKAAISYRDVAYTGQASDQHENMTYRHDEGRNAKFLENALNANREAALAAVAASIRRTTRG